MMGKEYHYYHVTCHHSSQDVFFSTSEAKQVWQHDPDLLNTFMNMPAHMRAMYGGDTRAMHYKWSFAVVSFSKSQPLYYSMPW